MLWWEAHGPKYRHALRNREKGRRLGAHGTHWEAGTPRTRGARPACLTDAVPKVSPCRRPRKLRGEDERNSREGGDVGPGASRKVSRVLALEEGARVGSRRLGRV